MRMEAESKDIQLRLMSPALTDKQRLKPQP
jgi:hypothetical protein